MQPTNATYDTSTVSLVGDSAITSVTLASRDDGSGYGEPPISEYEILIATGADGSAMGSGDDSFSIDASTFDAG